MLPRKYPIVFHFFLRKNHGRKIKENGLRKKLALSITAHSNCLFFQNKYSRAEIDDQQQMVNLAQFQFADKMDAYDERGKEHTDCLWGGSRHGA